jgi:hypothetical protein
VAHQLRAGHATPLTRRAPHADGRKALRFDLGAQTDLATTQDSGSLSRACNGYNGADRISTADQTNYGSTGANTRPSPVTGVEIVDASGLSTGVRGLDYFSAGTNETADAPKLPLSAIARTSLAMTVDLDLRGALNVKTTTCTPARAPTSSKAVVARTSAAEAATAYDLTLQGGDGNDDFYLLLSTATMAATRPTSSAARSTPTATVSGTALNAAREPSAPGASDFGPGNTVTPASRC